MKQTKHLHQPVIEACKNKDAKGQMQLYDLYCEAMFVIAMRYVKDRFIAEDIMQESFIKAFKNINNYKEEVTFGSWLKKIVINQSIDWLRKRKLELVTINEETTTIIDDNDDNWEVASNITYQQIVKCIENLKDKYKIVVTLFLLEGYDHTEISQILGITEVTSRTQLMRGKKQIQEQLKTVDHV